MRWRGVFAALLTVTFLTASSWTSFCELTCAGNLQRHVCPICGLSSHVAAAHMHCVQMDGQEGSNGAHAEPAALSHCPHAFCKQPASVSLPAKGFQPNQLKWTVRPGAQFENGAIPVRYVDKAPPPILIDSGCPLTVALRI